MITINFFKNGAYIKGHDDITICSVISYAMYSCINDSISANDDVTYYQSANDEKWMRLGFTFIEVNPNIKEHETLLYNFKANIWNWVDDQYPNRVKIINKPDELINWGEALQDAKREQLVG